MNLRVKLGRFFIRLGRIIESLVVVVMRPADLVDFNRLRYADRADISHWGEESLVDQGLSPAEHDLIAQLPIKNGPAAAGTGRWKRRHCPGKNRF